MVGAVSSRKGKGIMKFKKANFYGTHRRAYIKGADVVTVLELPDGKASAVITYAQHHSHCVGWIESTYISRKDLAAWLKVNRPHC